MRATKRRHIWIPALALTLVACGDRTAKPQPDRYPEVGQDVGRDAVSARPVQIGFDGPRFNACASFGRVTNLNPSGDATIAVLAAPAGSAEEVDRLGVGRGVSMCQKVGDWVGVVYPPAAAEGEVPVTCGTGAPVSTVRVYEGPCRSGWVDENFLKLVGG